MKIFKSIFFFLILLSVSSSCDKIKEKIDAMSGATKNMTQDGNSLFHQTDAHKLQIGNFEVLGEVVKPGKIDLDDYYIRDVVIKESKMIENQIQFTGAYRYIGYSLFDLLHPFNQNKKNMEAFRPAVDLYLVIKNDKNESVVFSWSEIFHVSNPHQIILATEMATIEPYKTKVDYPIAKTWKIVAANDLFAYRVLENPTSVKVLSFDKKEYEIKKGMKPMYSEKVEVFFDGNDSAFVILPMEDNGRFIRYYSTFYGMGMGYHKAEFFEGPILQELLKDQVNPFDESWNRHGLVCFVGLDGYRTICSFSEIFNRTDQSFPILAVDKDKEEGGGYYRYFQPMDFYADRSVKSLKEIYFFKVKE